MISLELLPASHEDAGDGTSKRYFTFVNQSSEMIYAGRSLTAPLGDCFPIPAMSGPVVFKRYEGPFSVRFPTSVSVELRTEGIDTTVMAT